MVFAELKCRETRPKMPVDMPTVQEKFVSVLLKMMRGRRSFSAKDARATAVTPPVGINTVRQRELQFSDFEGIAELRKVSGLFPDSLDSWDRLWRKNPALRLAKSRLPMGWVLEGDNKIVGYLGNIPLLYHFGDKPLLAVAASSFAVEPAYQTFSKDLAVSFYGQPKFLYPRLGKTLKPCGAKNWQKILVCSRIET
jgi:hypothetical protein